MNTAVPIHERSRLFDAYNRAVKSFVLGHTRMLNAQIAHYKLSLALCELHLEGETDAKRDCGVIATRLRTVTYEEYDAYGYLTNTSYIVYATTLLDTFLTETTRFLLLLFPKTLGKKQTVPLDIVLESTSRAKIIEDAVGKKVRELGHTGFLERLAFLREQFGLLINLSDQDIKELSHFSGIRNTVVHDQRVFELLLDDSCSVVAKLHVCPQHPTPIASKDYKHAEQVYKHVISKVYRAVVSDVLHMADNQQACDLLQLLTKSTA